MSKILNPLAVVHRTCSEQHFWCYVVGRPHQWVSQTALVLPGLSPLQRLQPVWTAAVAWVFPVFTEVHNIHWGLCVCVLQRSSAIHFENILPIERITVVVVVARGGVWGLLTSKRPLSLQAIFNWTLNRHLSGSSSFWSWRRSWQQRACSKARGRLVHALVLCFNPSIDRNILPFSVPHMQSYNLLLLTTEKAFHATPKFSIRMQLLHQI